MNMKTIFGFFSSALAGATAQNIAAAGNSGQTVVLNLRFTIPRLLTDTSNLKDKQQEKCQVRFVADSRRSVTT
jgi:hypothetical protein